MFITIEDESGVANLVIWPKLYEAHRRVIHTASMLGIEGRVQREGDVVHRVAWKVFDLSDLLQSVSRRSEPEISYPGRPARDFYDPTGWLRKQSRDFR